MTLNEIDAALYDSIKCRLGEIRTILENINALTEARKELKILAELEALPSCKDCMRQGCEYKPEKGEYERINCPLHKKSAI